MADSPIEFELLQQIRWSGLPEPETEFRACPPRRYRWDLAYPKTKLLIEVQGGIWHKSAHSTGVGISRDYEKNNIAVANGWRVLYFSADMVHSGKALNLIVSELNK